MATTKLQTEEESLVTRTLDWKGAAINAMALIAPGAFLWITYQVQAAATTPDGASCATDMWAGILVALVLAFLTAFSYAELAKIYPEAGFASCVYFAEKAFIDDQGLKRPGPTSMARVAKLITGWAAHLFYWVYPGVMVAFMATLVGYVANAIWGITVTVMWQMVISVVFAFAVSYIAYKGVQGSTKLNYWGNIIQWVTLVIFGILAVTYRVSNPDHATAWAFSGPVDIVKFHSIKGVLIQSTIAILILVGFESSTALAAETKQPEKNIPKAIIIALVVQGLLAYLYEYFCANMMVSEKLVGSVAVPAVAAVAAVPASVSSAGVTTAAVAAVAAAPATTKAVMGMDAVVASSAPIGDMITLIGNSMFGHIGFILMLTMSATVAIAVVCTTLACMNTAVRVTFGMAEDREVPKFLGFLHHKYASPHTAIWALAAISSAIAIIGVQSVRGLTGITLASNFGTFVLYGSVCIWTFIAFKKRKDFSFFKHALIPFLGLVMNVIAPAAATSFSLVPCCRDAGHPADRGPTAEAAPSVHGHGAGSVVDRARRRGGGAARRGARPGERARARGAAGGGDDALRGRGAGGQPVCRSGPSWSSVGRARGIGGQVRRTVLRLARLLPGGGYTPGDARMWSDPTECSTRAPASFTLFEAQRGELRRGARGGRAHCRA